MNNKFRIKIEAEQIKNPKINRKKLIIIKKVVIISGRVARLQSECYEILISSQKSSIGTITA